MRELRTHIVESEFVKLVRKHEKSGYQLVFLREHGDVKAVAGFRVTENLDRTSASRPNWARVSA